MTLGSSRHEVNSRKFGRSLLLAALGLGWAAVAFLAPAGATRADTPKPQETVFKNWTLSCVTPQPAEGSTTKPKQTCRIYHQVHSQADTTQILLVAAARYVAPNHTPMLILTLPPAANLQRGVNFQVDQDQIYKANIYVCTSAYCVAQFKLSDDLMKLFRNGTQATFTFALNPQGEAKYAVPLAGFAAALDALQKTGA